MPFDGVKELNVDQQIIAKAQDVLRKDGWCKHRLVDDANRKCVMGAIYGMGESWSFTLSPEMNAALFDEAEERGHPVPPTSTPFRSGHVAAAMWNNCVAETPEDVIDFLECVKARL